MGAHTGSGAEGTWGGRLSCPTGQQLSPKFPSRQCGVKAAPVENRRLGFGPAGGTILGPGIVPHGFPCDAAGQASSVDALARSVFSSSMSCSSCAVVAGLPRCRSIRVSAA
jgi:hypothetical protein